MERPRETIVRRHQTHHVSVALALGASQYELMLLPSWALFTVCAVLGVAGLLAAYRKPWTIALAFVAMLSISIVSIVQLRDPLGLSVAQRREAESWSYVAALFWSLTVGFTLPVIGLCLGVRSRSQIGRKPE